jgi:hypothetical protein
VNPFVVAAGGGVLFVPLGPGTTLNLPYQQRDPKLPAAAHIGSSIAAQQGALLNSALGGVDSGGSGGGVSAFLEKFV